MSTRSPEEGKNLWKWKKKLARVCSSPAVERKAENEPVDVHAWPLELVRSGERRRRNKWRQRQFFLLFAGRHVSYEMNVCTEEGEEVRKKNIHNEPLVFGRWGPWAVRFRRPTVPPCQHSISRLSFTVVQCNWRLWVFPFFGHDVSLLLQ